MTSIFGPAHQHQNCLGHDLPDAVHGRQQDMDPFGLPEFAGKEHGGFIGEMMLPAHLAGRLPIVPERGEGGRVHAVIHHPVEGGAGAQPGPFSLQDETAAGDEAVQGNDLAGRGLFPFAQGFVEIVHVQDDRDLRAKAVLQVAGQ